MVLRVAGCAERVHDGRRVASVILKMNHLGKGLGTVQTQGYPTVPDPTLGPPCLAFSRLGTRLRKVIFILLLARNAAFSYPSRFYQLRPLATLDRATERTELSCPLKMATAHCLRRDPAASSLSTTLAPCLDKQWWRRTLLPPLIGAPAPSFTLHIILIPVLFNSCTFPSATPTRGMAGQRGQPSPLSRRAGQDGGLRVEHEALDLQVICSHLSTRS